MKAISSVRLEYVLFVFHKLATNSLQDMGRKARVVSLIGIAFDF